MEAASPLGSRLLQRKCACGGNPGVAGECEDCRRKRLGGVQRKAIGTGPMPSAAAIVHEALQSPGQPLDHKTRAYMEPRFGHMFSQISIHHPGTSAPQGKLHINQPGDLYEQEADHVANKVIQSQVPGAGSTQSQWPNGTHNFNLVRIHTDGIAAKAANAIRARAFTVGQDIVFGAGEYAPNSNTGRQLLAHELTHVAQQGGSAGLVQRAEVDDRSCAGLTDIETDVDTKVNSEIAAARTAAGTPISIPAFLKDVKARLGSGAISPIEKFIEALAATKRTIPPKSLSGTKYSGVDAVNRFYKLQTLGMAHVVGSSAKVAGICIGADKLGHFFGEGFLYFQITSPLGLGLPTTDAQSAGRALEIGIQGLGVGAAVGTGVFSNADQAANLAGMQFYKDLQADPTKYKFSVKKYITNQWNEQSNPSFYDSSVGGVVWGNLLTGPWQGPFTSGTPPTPTDTHVNLSATASSVTGTYEWPPIKPTHKGKIKNGVITQKTTSVSGTIPGESPVSATPVSGISIAYDWETTTTGTTGKGVWNSVNEQTLEGTWGNGSSSTNGGSWNIKKI